MSETNTPLHDLLPAQVYSELKYKLHKNLPEPPTGEPADVERRLHSAIAEIAAYGPAGAAELNLARRHVEAAEAADECLRLAHEAAGEQSPDTTKLRAQSASFMRQAQGYHTRLLRMQNLRRKLEKDPQATTRAAWTEHCTIRLLADDEPPESPSPEPATAPPSPPPAPEPLPPPKVSTHDLASPIHRNETLMRLAPQVHQAGGPRSVSPRAPSSYPPRNETVTRLNIPPPLAGGGHGEGAPQS